MAQGNSQTINEKRANHDELIKQNFEHLSKPVKDESRGTFSNPFSTWRDVRFADLLKWQLTERNDSGIPKSKEELDKELPIVKPDFTFSEQDAKLDLFRTTWIGHATVLIQVNGINILTDPIFSQRASPVQFAGPKRYRDAACNIDSLPDPIHYVLISHSHYDHLDTNSVRELNKRFGSKCRWLVPLGLGSYLRSMSVSNYAELDWWQKDSYQLATESQVNIYLTPNQHWSKRTAFDTNKSLWGSFTIVNRHNSTFFFAGDTGYCPVFKEIGEIFGPFSGAAIPIGAYKPRWFMKAAHVDPEDARQIHEDLGSFKSMAIHHATFPLGYEYYKEPAETLASLMRNSKKPFITVKHGESTIYPGTSSNQERKST